MNIDDVRAWWEENLMTVELHQDVRELVVQKIISTYAAGIFTGARAARKSIRELAEKRKKASPADVMFPRAPEANNVNIAANAARDRIRKSVDDMKAGQINLHNPAPDR